MKITKNYASCIQLMQQTNKCNTATKMAGKCPKKCDNCGENSWVYRKALSCGVMQGGTICSAIEESSRSLKSIDKRVFTNFRDKNAVFTNFRDKHGVFTNFCDKNAVFTNFRDKNAVFTNFRGKNAVFINFRDKNAVFTSSRDNN